MCGRGGGVMFSSRISPTKEKIYLTALDLFSKRGYTDVSMRDLAKAVGISSPAIYNHFETKKDILIDLYKTYNEQRKMILPDLEKMLLLAEIKHPHEVLIQTDYHFAPDVENAMNRILSIGARGMAIDEDSRKFIVENVISAPGELIVPVLNRMIELNRIEPMEVGMFETILIHYCYSAVSLCATPLHVKLEDWKTGLQHLFKAFVKPIEK
jgi:AcrR family transcriptional regulator